METKMGFFRWFLVGAALMTASQLIGCGKQYAEQERVAIAFLTALSSGDTAVVAALSAPDAFISPDLLRGSELRLTIALAMADPLPQPKRKDNLVSVYFPASSSNRDERGIYVGLTGTTPPLVHGIQPKPDLLDD